MHQVLVLKTLPTLIFVLFKGVPSTSGASTTTTTMTTDSKTCSCSKQTTDYGEKYEVIPLDTGIMFDCEGYRVPTFMPVEDQPRWRVYPEGVYFHVWVDMNPCYIDQTIDDEHANEFSIEQVSASCTYKPVFIQECHRTPVSVDKYVDYLYSVADAHSAKVTAVNRMMFFFKLKEVHNLVIKKTMNKLLLAYHRVCIHILKMCLKFYQKNTTLTYFKHHIMLCVHLYEV